MRSAAPVEKVHCNHIVKVPTGKRAAKVAGRQKLYFPANIRRNLGTLLKCHRGNWVFPARNSQERVREETFPTAELENRLPRQKMNDMAERLGAPQQTIRDNRIVLSPIILAISFPDSKCRMKRGVSLHRYGFHHWIDDGSCVAPSPLKERSDSMGCRHGFVLQRLLASGFGYALSVGESTNSCFYRRDIGGVIRCVPVLPTTARKRAMPKRFR